MSIRVLFQMCLPDEPRAAGRQQSVRVCHHLAKAGAHVTMHLWTDYFANPAEVIDYFGLEHEPRLTILIHPANLGSNPSPRRVWFKGMLWHVRRILKLLLTSEKRSYDLYYGRGKRYPGIHAALKRLLRYTVLVECHEIHYLDGLSEDELLSVQPKFDLERLAYRKADGVIFLTDALKQLAERKWGPVPRTTVIPSGGTVRECEPRPIERPISRVCFIGNPYPFSGIDDLIRAMTYLPETISLQLVGGDLNGGDIKRIRGIVEENSLAGRIELTGYVMPVELPAYYAHSDVLVMPLRVTPRSNYFMSPLKMFEYMTSRRPIVATDVPVVREVLKDGDNALLVEPENPRALADAINRLVHDQTLAHQLAERAYADAGQYALENKCTRMLAFMESIGSNRGDQRQEHPVQPGVRDDRAA